jgi:hypothetical protein
MSTLEWIFKTCESITPPLIVLAHKEKPNQTAYTRGENADRVKRKLSTSLINCH